MTQHPDRSLITRLRQVFPTLFRQRHTAVIKAERAPTPKLEPITKILSDTGRDRGAHAD
jgi:hypothetical protein